MALDPFNTSTDPDLYVPLPRTEGAIDAIVAALDRGTGCVALIGPPGIGKTLVLRLLARRLPPHYETLAIPHPGLDPTRMLADWLDERDAGRPGEAAEAAERPLVLLVDEALHVPLETARELRRLREECAGALRIVLAACPEPEFVPILDEIDPLAVPVGLEGPFEAPEIAALVQGRLQRAEAAPVLREVLDGARLREVASSSEGCPRTAIQQAERAAFAAVAAPREPTRNAIGPRFGLAAMLGVAILAFGILRPGREPAPITAVPDVAAGMPAPAAERATVPVHAPNPEPVASAPRERDRAAEVAPSAEPDAATAGRAEPLAPRPAAPSEPVSGSVAVATPRRALPRPAPSRAPASPHVPVVVNAVPSAQIWVDGEALGATPVVRHELPAGSHLFTARFEDGRQVERRVQVEGEIVYLSFP